MRLQNIRKQKLAKQFAANADSEEDGDEEKAAVKVESSEEIGSSDDDGDEKLGDRLFDSGDDEGHEETKKAAEMTDMDPDLVRKIIETDSPELLSLLEEFKEALN